MDVKFTVIVTAIYLVYTSGFHIYVRFSWIEIGAHAQSLVSAVFGVYPTHWALLYGKPVFCASKYIPYASDR